MQIEITDKEKELHIHVIEDNLNWWMFDCGNCEDYYREICSAILLLEKLTDENYRFAGHSWVSGKSFTIAEIKADYIASLKEYADGDDSFLSAQAREALEFVQEVFPKEGAK